MASVVGETGRVTAVELDAKLAGRATDNLRSFKQVTVVAADASQYRFDDADAILVNAGATRPVPRWLDGLRPLGKLLLPLTMANGSGGVFKIARREQGFSARFIMGIVIFKCAGARDRQEEERLQKAFLAGGANLVRSLRRIPHENDPSCWSHSDNFCLSKIDEDSENVM